MARKISRRDREAFAALDAIYAQMPSILCTGKCAGACGAIPLTDLEARRLQLAGHQKARTLPMAATDQDGAAQQRCIYLTPTNRCSVYAARPLICRAYGLVRMLSCPFGCVPDRWLKDLDFLHLAHAIERIGGGRVLRTGPDGLSHEPGESYTRIEAERALGPPRFSPEQMERNSERTRGLRALHGGRILIAVEDDH